MFCHFDVTLEKALGLSLQPQPLLGEPRPSLVTKVAELVSGGEIRAAFLMGRQEAGSLQRAAQEPVAFPKPVLPASPGTRISVKLAVPRSWVKLCPLASNIAVPAKGAGE